MATILLDRPKAADGPAQFVVCLHSLCQTLLMYTFLVHGPTDFDNGLLKYIQLPQGASR